MYIICYANQFHFHIVLGSNDKGARRRRKGAIEKAEGAQLCGIIEVLARLNNVHSLATDQRQYQTEREKKSQEVS